MPIPNTQSSGKGTENWYIAIVNSRHEKKASEQLTSLGVRNYVATQTETRRWSNGRRKTVERVVISTIVFIHCTEQERRRIVTYPFINRFMTNRTADSGTLNKPVAIIPDHEMQRLMYMLGHADSPVDFTPVAYRMKDRVKVVRGQLKGLEGEIIAEPDGSHRLQISLSLLGGVTVAIDPHDVVPLS